MHRVLIIDESLTVRMDLKEAFEAAGCATLLCDTAAAAREQFSRGAFALAVLDTHIPDGTGIELLRELRSNPVSANIPVILLASEAELGEPFARGRTARDVCVGKPYVLANIIAQARRMLPTAATATIATHVQTVDPGRARPQRRSPQRILAVDDSPTYLHALAEQLSLEGVEVVLACSGHEALEKLAAEAVDGILLDLVMPDLSGEETCRRIKSSLAWRGIPVLMLTAHEDRQTMIACFNAGADDFIAKSSEFEVLRSRLRAQLRRKQFEDENAEIHERLHQQEVEATEARAHRQADEATRVMARQWRETFDAISDGVCVTDSSLRILRANAALAGILGRPVDHLVGAALREVFPAELKSVAGVMAPQLLQTRLRQTAELQLRGAWYRITADPVDAGPATQPGGVFILSDIDQQKQAAEQLRRATQDAEAANQAKDHFLAVLSHELRTPLTPVLVSVDLLERDAQLPERFRKDIELIRRNVELEARLIDDLLDVTRITRGKTELDRRPIALSEVIRRTVEVCKADIENRQLEFGVDMGDAAACIVQADATRLMQVFWNLLRNAIKFTPHGGCVGIRCREDVDGQVIVEVSDSGAGIDAEVLPRLFKAFEQGGAGMTRQFGGLGLGLMISKGLVELHGGSIEALSAGKGKGATFRVRLPWHRGKEKNGGDAQKNFAEFASKTPAAPVRPLCILLVEDHGDTAIIMRRLLMKDGHEVQIAGDVATALELAGARAFDLLISDLGLPDGNGVDLMRELRKRGCTVPGIALSGYGQDEDILRTKEAGFAAHLIKPTSPARLTEAIAVVTGSTALSAEL